MHDYITHPNLRQLLETGADDAAVCEAYDQLRVSLNCEGAAKGYLAAVGFICTRRPHLANWLLRQPIDALLQLGLLTPLPLHGSLTTWCESRVITLCSGLERMVCGGSRQDFPYIRGVNAAAIRGMLAAA